MASTVHRHFEMRFSHLVGNEAEPADIFLDMVGHCRSRGTYDYVQEAPLAFMRVMTAGSGFADIGTRRLPLSSGQLFIYWPGTPVRFHDTPRSPWTFTFLSFGGARVADALRRAGFAASSRAYDLGEGMDAVVRRLGAIRERFRRGDVGPLFPVAAAWDLLLCASEAAGLRSCMHTGSDLAQRARRLMRQDDAPASVSAVAAGLGVSRTTLFRAFAAAYAMSPKDYLEQVRLERACNLLATTDLPILDVALRSGYEDAAYFSRRFHRRFKTTPSAWRRARVALLGS